MFITISVTIYNICQRLKLEGETENMSVYTKERKGDTAEVLMATPERRMGFIMIIDSRVCVCVCVCVCVM